MGKWVRGGGAGKGTVEKGTCRGGGRGKGNLTKGMSGGGEERRLWVNGCVEGGGGGGGGDGKGLCSR